MIQPDTTPPSLPFEVQGKLMQDPLGDALVIIVIAALFGVFLIWFNELLKFKKGK